jgi:hypothetical protein
MKFFANHKRFGLKFANVGSVIESPLGQVRDCIGLFEEDRIWILKPPWLAWLWKKAVTAACDPEI